MQNTCFAFRQYNIGIYGIYVFATLYYTIYCGQMQAVRIAETEEPSETTGKVSF